nr:unnamed protein product [Callosobruchus analis]
MKDVHMKSAQEYTSQLIPRIHPGFLPSSFYPSQREGEERGFYRRHHYISVPWQLRWQEGRHSQVNIQAIFHLRSCTVQQWDESAQSEVIRKKKPIVLCCLAELCFVRVYVVRISLVFFSLRVELIGRRKGVPIGIELDKVSLETKLK